MALAEIIIQKIRKEGPISFRDFMEMALYDPGYGYYTSAGNKIGRQGDYYTSPYVSSIFGDMIGKQIEEMWRLMHQPAFTIVEYGAGTGTLCLDILTYLKSNEALYEHLSYCIIEKSPAMREKEKKVLTEKVKWYDSIQDISGITGCILSNEVADNFAVHQVVMQNELMEIFVDYDHGFVERMQPASPELNDYFKQLKVSLPKGYRCEINMQATGWIKEIALALQKGFVLTIDYGFPSGELYNRPSGTLVCYHQHLVNENPYQYIGEQDITAHVNFSALTHWGLANGLACNGYTNQANFLLGLGLAAHLKNREESASGHREIYTLLMDMGNKLKILVQHKGFAAPKLSGLQFARHLV